MQNGLDVFALEQFVRHKALRTTRGDVALEHDDLQCGYERASPVDPWGLK
jgi:hypothetical protein